MYVFYLAFKVPLKRPQLVQSASLLSLLTPASPGDSSCLNRVTAQPATTHAGSGLDFSSIFSLLFLRHSCAAHLLFKATGPFLQTR